MKVQVVIDNISKSSLLKEWGLCVYIEYGDKRYLLDSGSSATLMTSAMSRASSLKRRKGSSFSTAALTAGRTPSLKKLQPPSLVRKYTA